MDLNSCQFVLLLTLMGQVRLVSFIMELNTPGQESETLKEDPGEDGTVTSPSDTHMKMGASR